MHYVVMITMFISVRKACKCIEVGILGQKFFVLNLGSLLREVPLYYIAKDMIKHSNRTVIYLHQTMKVF